MPLESNRVQVVGLKPSVPGRHRRRCDLGDFLNHDLLAIRKHGECAIFRGCPKKTKAYHAIAMKLDDKGAKLPSPIECL